MAVKILIKRKVSADKAAQLRDLIMKLRMLVVKQPGYVSGESLQNMNKPDEYLVIGTWTGIEAWNAWLASKERAEVQDKIDALLGEKTVYESYQYRE